MNRMLLLGAMVMGVAGAWADAPLFAQAGKQDLPRIYRDEAPPAPASYYTQTNTVEGFPAAEVREVPLAKANAVAAKWQHELARKMLDLYVRQSRQDAQLDPKLVHARADRELAYEQLQLVRLQALAPLVDDAKYQALKQEQSAVGEQIAAESARKHPDRERILALARLKLHFASRITALEQDRLLSSAQVQSAEADYRSTAARVREIEAASQYALSRDQQLAELRQNVELTRINYLASDAYLQSAVRARNIAIRYAMYLHRDARYRYESRWLPVYGDGIYDGRYGRYDWR